MLICLMNMCGKSDLKNSRKPLVYATSIFIVLFGGVTLMSLYYDFSQTDLGVLLFFMAFLCSLFIARNTFEAVKAGEVTVELKQMMATDRVVSSDELYLQLYKNSPVPYLILDSLGRVKSANISALRLLGINQNRVKGYKIFEQLKSEKKEHIDLLIEKYHSGVSVGGEVVEVIRPDFVEAWALLSLFSFSDVAGQKIGLLTLVDITRQKKTEEAKTEFVSLASHQLRTPIAGLKWSAELLQMDSPENLTDRQNKYIERILDSIKKMSVLVDDFLRVSRFELGTLQAEYMAVSLSRLFNDIVAEQRGRAKQKNLEIKTFFEKEIDTVISDPNLLRMIVTNLYSNAVKYTKPGGTVHLGFSRKEGNLLISVADNGMGIPIAEQDQIFTKLFRASNAVRDVPEGTGLGLYIVKEAVSVLRGNISFNTTEQSGTTFEVSLPLELPRVNED
jgi:PAS domain S-box-containing protein